MGVLHDSSRSSSEANVCPDISLAQDASTPFVGDMSFYTFSKILSGICVAFALVVTVGQMSKPSRVYLEPWLDVFQAWALATFFLLVCDFVSQSEPEREIFFSNASTGKLASMRSDARVRWYKKRWPMIMQYPIVALLVALATVITQASSVYCQFESKPYFARLWLNIIQTVSTVIAIIAVVKLTVVTSKQLVGHQLMFKLLAFKSIVGLTLIQKIIFGALRDNNTLKPTATLSYADLNIGIPAMITCLELAPLSVLYAIAYSPRSYAVGRPNTAHETGGPLLVEPRYYGGSLGLGAWLNMWNPYELLEAIGKAFNMYPGSRKGRDIALEP